MVFTFQQRGFDELFSLLYLMCMETINQYTFCIFPGAMKPHQYLDTSCNASQNGHLVLSCGNTLKTGNNSAPFFVCYPLLLLTDLGICLISPHGSLSNI
jgi:hypothetical protein